MNELEWKEIMDGSCFPVHTGFYGVIAIVMTEIQTVEIDNTTCHLTLTPRISELENILVLSIYGATPALNNHLF